MSLTNFFGDVFHARFNSAWQRIKDEFGNDIAPALEAWIKKFLTDEGKLLLNSSIQFAQDVASGKSMQDAGTALVTQMASQGITVLETDAMDAIRTQLSAIQGSSNASVGN